MKEMSLSSAGAQRQSAETAKASMKISIIVPVLNEGERLRPFLEHLRERAPSAEVILVNAVGSQTVSERAVALCDRVLTSGRGRAAQMNAGATPYIVSIVVAILVAYVVAIALADTTNPNPARAIRRRVRHRSCSSGRLPCANGVAAATAAATCGRRSRSPAAPNR